MDGWKNNGENKKRQNDCWIKKRVFQQKKTGEKENKKICVKKC